MKMAILGLAANLSLPAMAAEFASAPLNKISMPVCNHGTCTTFTLLSVLPLANGVTQNDGELLTVVYKAVNREDATSPDGQPTTNTYITNDVVFCSKSTPMLFQHGSMALPDLWAQIYLHPGNGDQWGSEEWQEAIYMAVCHNDLKFDAQDVVKTAHRLGYAFKSSDPMGEDDLPPRTVSPYQFIQMRAKAAEAKPNLKSDPFATSAGDKKGGDSTATNPSAKDMDNCSKITKPLERLMCFDVLSGHSE